jgi:hypothetical protein
MTADDLEKVYQAMLKAEPNIRGSHSVNNWICLPPEDLPPLPGYPAKTPPLLAPLDQETEQQLLK